MARKSLTAEMARLREQRWTTKDARRVLAACDGSGLSVAGFARQHGLKDQRLNWWRRRLGEWEGRSVATGTRFVPAVVQESSVVIGGTVAIRLPDGMMVEIAEASPQWVASLLRGLCGASS